MPPETCERTLYFYKIFVIGEWVSFFLNVKMALPICPWSPSRFVIETRQRCRDLIHKTKLFPMLLQNEINSHWTPNWRNFAVLRKSIHLADSLWEMLATYILNTRFFGWSNLACHSPLLGNGCGVCLISKVIHCYYSKWKRLVVTSWPLSLVQASES